MSEPTIIKVARLVTNNSGESRFENATMPLSLKEFAPPAAPFHVTEPQPAENYVVINLAVGWDGEHHPAPSRLMAFILTGCVRITASSGEARLFSAGDGILLDDTSGKGHRTEVISDEPATAVMIRLA